jgi:predicted small lipoprotein YifL
MIERKIAWILIAAAAAAGTACGKKGPLLEPLSRTPKTPTAVACIQRGDRIFVTWTNPEAYIDGHPVAGLSSAEVWLLAVPKPPAPPPPATPPAVSPEPSPAAKPAVPAAGAQPASPPANPPAALPAAAVPAPPSADTVATTGRLAGRVEGAALKAGGFDFLLAKEDYAGVVLHVAVLVRDSRGRASNPGGPAAWEPRPLPLPPAELLVRIQEDRLSLAWRPPTADTAGGPATPSGYLVYRSDTGRPLRLLTPAPVKEAAFDDFDFSFGGTYRYVVRAAAGDAAPYVESADSPALDVVPKDVFPPAAPTGLVAVSGGGFVALSWEPGPEKDLAGYRVRRRAAGEGDFRLLTPAPVPENAFSDTTGAKGLKYVYAVSAVDREGNEGPRSETAVEGGAEG